MAGTLNMISSLAEISKSYSVILSDVWGVLHNGVDAFSHAEAALEQARQSGIAVVLITNAPRLWPDVEKQITGLGVKSGYDRIVTSGDVTRQLVKEGPRKIFHLGPERDLGLYEGLEVELVEEFEAQVVVCTGFFDDETETPDDYADMLRRFRARNLPFVCANPDIVVERGHRLIYCAGALARDYAQLGGRTLIAGKPHRPIYDAAMQAACELLGRELDRSEILAIGDGMMTDVKGAEDYGLDILYVSAGIHAGEYGNPHEPDEQLLAEFLARHGHHPVAVIPRLR
ncbi:TIGR01459 family HAD-type hydrolase [Pseudaminobacter sp. 19-2017]|uniref:TIGR01459 family HAD-type hydrolase n=1 Tax=Pseudaminobacter soli (ex Zhang et al. 2022) TaxID=2831468 RepID=A0A942DYS1_9HYPH|nr:TIGR01459 family HAD-type hydrolase [Pseudaminobacter soli]MBS3647400.1 TIGR01459 family HAD-type hydrolase [Pseudaminobacter soli]